MRYRFYRVHKYVCFELSEFDRQAAKTDFLNNDACEALKEKWVLLANLLKHHAEYEDDYIHDLLRQKKSQSQSILEKDHQQHELDANTLLNKLEQIALIQVPSQRILLGHDFYLAYRLFYSEMLKHLYEEEKTLLPQIQALYTDAELAKLQAKTYQKMTPEQMLGMLNVLFPHANPEDMYFFANEMKAAEPEKFEMVWKMLAQDYKQLIISHSQHHLADA